MKEAWIATLSRQVRDALRRSHVEDARTALLHLEAEAPLTLETRGLGLELLIREESFAEAEPLSSQLLELHPDSPRVHYLAGWLAYRQRRYREAEDRFRESDRIHPHWSSRRYLGKSLTQSGDLEKAEAILVPLSSEHFVCHLDLAWLYERKTDFSRALAHIEKYLERDPDNVFAADQRVRLKARSIPREDLLAEVEELESLGEPIPDSILPDTIETLFASGLTKRAREVIAGVREDLSPAVRTRVAWVSYRAHAYDCAFEIFLDIFDRHRGDPKFRRALETAAARCQRTAELLERYREAAARDPSFYGRIRSLEKRARRQAEKPRG